MKNNICKEQAFRNRIADCTLERKVITQNELENIAKRVKSRSEMYFKNTDIEIDIEDVLRRCKENMEDGGKYILTPQSEEINNPANIVPLEEKALMELFKTGDSYSGEALVLLGNQRVELKYNKHDSENMEETIEISFENVKDKNDTPQYEFVN